MEAMKLNVPLYNSSIISALSTRVEKKYVILDKPNVFLDALKLDEDGQKNLILRVHENQGYECSDKCMFVFGIGKVIKVNILEDPMDDWEIIGEDGKVMEKDIIVADPMQVIFKVKPYQVFTMKIGGVM